MWTELPVLFTNVKHNLWAHSINSIKLFNLKRVKYAYNRIWSIILFAHYPWHISVKTHSHICKPLRISFSRSTSLLFNWAIFILNLQNVINKIDMYCYFLLLITCRKKTVKSFVLYYVSKEKRPETLWLGHPEAQTYFPTSSCPQFFLWISALLPACIKWALVKNCKM